MGVEGARVLVAEAHGTGGRGARGRVGGALGSLGVTLGATLGAAFGAAACAGAPPADVAPRPTAVAAAAAAADTTARPRAAADTVAPPAPPVDTAGVGAAVAAGAAAAGPPADPELPVDPTDGRGGVRWVGRDADRTIPAADRALLRTVFGIDDVRRLFLPAAGGDVLRYASHAPGCSDESRVGARRGSCRVVSVRVGLAAPRAAGETWDGYTGRVVRGGTGAWAADGRVQYQALGALVPEAARAFERLVDDARAAGFPVHVRETFRTPERQAYILARGDGRTTTATSAHSYGRAVDLSVADGAIGRRSTYRTWVDFRRWVLGQQNGAFRLIGTPERTWDWPHVEYVGTTGGPPLGYPTVDALVAAARACRSGSASDAEAAERCTTAPPRPADDVQATLVSDEAPARRSRGGRRGSRHASRHDSRHSRSRGKSSRAPSHAKQHSAHAERGGARRSPKHRSAR